MFLAVDFGGTRMRAAWYDATLRQRTRLEEPTKIADGPEAVLARLIALARRALPPAASPSAIGISAGCARAYTGLIANAPTLPGWNRVPLAALVSQAFGGVPVYMENDANLAALAEYHLGAAEGCDPALYLTISTGIGGGAVIGGKLFTGWRGLAIEPGHLKFPTKDGKLYSLEALASGPALARAATTMLERTPAPSRLRSLPEIDGQAVGEAALDGDPIALAVVGEAARWLGLGLVNLVHLLNPQCIVLGGSVTKLGDLLLNPARAVLAAQLLDPLFYAEDLLRPARLGEDVCLVGAALYARQLFEEAGTDPRPPDDSNTLHWQAND